MLQYVEPVADDLSSMWLHDSDDGRLVRGLLAAALLRRGPLTEVAWYCLPRPCPALETALPAVAARSLEEAGQLVQYLPSSTRERLREAARALCCAAPERLPAPLRDRILSMSVAPYTEECVEEYTAYMLRSFV